MGIRDAILKMSSAGTYFSGTVGTFESSWVDFGGAFDPSIGETLFLNVQVNTAFADSTDGATIVFNLVESDDAASWATLMQLGPGLINASDNSPAIATAGTLLFRVPLPLGCERYLMFEGITATQGHSAGLLDVWIDKD